ncbi:MAG: hypothetical protein WA239_05490 [Candidatus Sulfotelmatobacter sp.]
MCSSSAREAGRYSASRRALCPKVFRSHEQVDHQHPGKDHETPLQWAWPGNIREPEDFMERSVILTPGLVLQVPLSELNTTPAESNGDTLRERERERIVRALRECNGQLGGPTALRHALV